MTIVVTHEGIPLGLRMSGSNVHDVNLVEPLIANLSIKIAGSNLVGDKGYISRVLKSRLSVAGINLVYPMRVNQGDVNSSEERALLRVRNIVENVFSWQQLNRRIRLRYEVSSCSLSSFYYLGLLVLINRKIDFWYLIYKKPI